MTTSNGAQPLSAVTVMRLLEDTGWTVTEVFITDAKNGDRRHVRTKFASLSDAMRYLLTTAESMEVSDGST